MVNLTNWHFSPYALALIVSALISVTVAGYAWRRRQAPGALALTLAMLAAAFWALAYAVQLGLPTLEAKLWWTRVQYLGIVSAPGLLFAVVLQATGQSDRLKRWWPFLVLPSLITLGLVWTNEAHHLIWTTMQLRPLQTATVLVLEHGLGIALFAGYGYLLLLLGGYLLWQTRRQAAYLQAGQAGALLGAIWLPAMGTLLYLLRWGPLPYLDLTPVGYALAGTIIARALFRYHLFELLPIARSTVLEGLADAVFVLEARGRIVDLNRAAGQFLGRELREVVGQTVTQALLHRFNHVERYLDLTTTQTQTVVGVEQPQRYYNLRTSPLYDPAGALCGWVVVIHDITAQKQAEQALQTYQQQLEAQNAELQKLSLAVAQSANAVIIANSQGEIEYVNPKYEETSGYQGAEVLGRPLSTMREESMAALHDLLWQTVQEGLEWQGEFRNRRKDGSSYWVRTTAAPVYDATRQLTHVIIIEEDITERKNAEAILYRFTERLQTLRELEESILAARSPGTIAMVAVHRMRHLIPCQRALVIEQSAAGTAQLLAAEADASFALQVPLALYHPLFAEPALQAGQIMGSTDLAALPTLSFFQKKLYEEGVRSYMIIPLIVRQTLIGLLHLQSNRAAAFTADHVAIATEIAATLAVAIEQAHLYELAQQEISERRQAELTLQDYTRELEARNTELDAFAHTVAHDLKTPLTTVLGFSELLVELGPKLPPQKAQECLLMIGKSAEKMNSIVNELLLLASIRRIEEVPIQPLNMDKIIAEVQQRLSNTLADYQGILQLPTSWPLAVGYAPWVEEVWVNYISNALKYGGTPPHVEIGWDLVETDTAADEGSPRQQARFWVLDNGAGLTEEEQGRLFTPFTRLDQGRAKGHGLGLSIVRRIVEKMKGQVGVESQMDQGSRFYFTLPLATEWLPPAS